MYYDIFISYKNDGSGNIFAEKLANDLKEMGYSVYFNSHERSSGNFGERIQRAIASCSDFIAIASNGYINQLLRPQDVRSDWIRQELMEAWNQSEHITITPIYLEGVPKPSSSDFIEGDAASFFATLDGVVMPGDSYDISPLQALIDRLKSEAGVNNGYRYSVNDNPAYQAREILRGAYGRALKGDYDAMYQIGYMLFYGMCPSPKGGVVRDYSEAYRWLKRVSEESESQELRDDANTLLGMLYYQGQGTPDGQNYAKSLEYHEKAHGNSYSAAHAFFMRKSGIGCEFDYAGIEGAFEGAAQSGDNGIWANYGMYLESLGRIPEAAEAYQHMNPMSARVHHRLGTIFRNGSHVFPPKPDIKEAIFHLEKAVEMGSTDAALELGTIYLRPPGAFPQDYHRAQKYLEYAAEAGNWVAHYQLGYMFEYGHAKKDGFDPIAEAIRHYEIAASQGEMMSATHLAALYQLPQCCNYSKAFQYASLSAESGQAKGEFELGNLYLLGRGCAYDIYQAKYWYERSVGHGFTLAIRMLRVVEELIDKTGGEVPDWLL